MAKTRVNRELYKPAAWWDINAITNATHCPGIQCSDGRCSGDCATTVEPRLRKLGVASCFGKPDPAKVLPWPNSRNLLAWLCLLRAAKKTLGIWDSNNLVFETHAAWQFTLRDFYWATRGRQDSPRTFRLCYGGEVLSDVYSGKNQWLIVYTPSGRDGVERIEITEFVQWMEANLKAHPYDPKDEGVVPGQYCVAWANYCRRFAGGDYEREISEWAFLWTLRSTDTDAMIGYAARQQGLGIAEFLALQALAKLQEYVAKRPRLLAIAEPSSGAPSGPAPKAATPQTAGKSRPPLSDQERKAFDIIRAMPPGEAISLKDLEKKSGVDAKVLTSHIIPALKQHYGVKNRRNVGYYIDQPASETA